MNNFFLNQDPLLQQPQPQPTYPQYPDYSTMVTKDWVGDLDKQMRSLDPSIVTELNNNPEFVELNASLQTAIQDELMNLVRSRLNIQPDIIDGVKKLMEMIKRANNKVKEDERKSMNELNDYMKNYSHLTFDEYRKIKYEQGRTETTNQ